MTVVSAVSLSYEFPVQDNAHCLFIYLFLSDRTFVWGRHANLGVPVHSADVLSVTLNCPLFLGTNRSSHFPTPNYLVYICLENIYIAVICNVK